MTKNTPNVHKIVMSDSLNKRLEENVKIKSLRFQEKGYSSELQLRGRKSYFEEFFDGISLENQDLPVVGPFQNIRETESFQGGRQRAFFLVNNGFTLEQYQKFLSEFEAKFPEEAAKKHR